MYTVHEKFDNYFKGLYRENSFLNHYKVPRNIKESVSPKIYIDSDSRIKTIEKGNNTLLFNTGDNLKLDVETVLLWLGSGDTNKFNVLKFDSMYFRINFSSNLWDKKLNDSLKMSTYRQSE